MKGQFYRSLYILCVLVLVLLVTACTNPPVQIEPVAKGIAAVNANGSLLRGVNVVSVERVDVGRYRVTFNSKVDVANGYYFVTPGLIGSCNMVSQAEKSTGNSVWVSFADHRSPGVHFSDCAFSLVVF